MREIGEKVAQLIMPRLDGSRINTDNDYFSQSTSLIDAGIGGFILFGGSMPETPYTIGRLQERAKAPLLITSDIERGLGQQLEGGTRFPNQWAVAEAIGRENPDDISLLHKMLNIVREDCIAAGIHAVFSPVADVNSNPGNPIICTRSFGEEPKRVSWFVKEYVKGLQGNFFNPPQSPLNLRGEERGVISCAKHFPGHGDTAVDSHTSLPVISADKKRLEIIELPPFKAAIEAGVGMVMVGHLCVPALEPEPVPATFSKRIVTDILRGEMGFKGLVVTDALDMGALKTLCDEGETGVRALAAGCDILLHPSEPLKMVEAVVKAVGDGRLPPERVEDAFNRVMEVKRRFHIGAYSNTPLPADAGNIQIAERIAKKSIRFRKVGRLSSSENVVCLVIDDDGNGSMANPFLNAMKERFPNIRIASSPSEIADGETVVVPLFSKVSAWKGSSGLSKDSLEKAKSAIVRGGRTVLISFGSPYILNSFNADVMINAFDPADFMQMAVVERLAVVPN